MKLTIKQEISNQQIASLLCNAFEGGSNYWSYDVTNFNPGERADEHGLTGYWPRYVKAIFTGNATIEHDTGDGDNKKTILDMSAIEIGMKIFAKKYPKHFADWLNGNDDATISDVFLQCCLLGEVIFG